MEVAKMRGAATLAGLHTFRITSRGIQVFAPPPLSGDSGADSMPPQLTRLSVGVPELDEMRGGGIPRGYSLLIAGPSGSGKSILAGAFMEEGGRRGETGVIAAFEQRPNRSRGRAINELIDSGRVGVIDTRALNVSVDEISALLLAEIHRLKASRVLIDSLSGFELALAPTFREDFRESVARMISALASTGVTVLVTSELEDRYDDLRFSPYGTAFLTDAIIVQRYIEVDSQLKRVMAVVKVRASKHSNDLRLFDIDGDGIKIGQKLVEFEGLLGGRPTRRPRARDPSSANDA
jgi:circadian clock protein KaiC